MFCRPAGAREMTPTRNPRAEARGYYLGRPCRGGAHFAPLTPLILQRFNLSTGTSASKASVLNHDALRVPWNQTRTKRGRDPKAATRVPTFCGMRTQTGTHRRCRRSKIQDLILLRHAVELHSPGAGSSGERRRARFIRPGDRRHQAGGRLQLSAVGPGQGQ